MFDLMCDGVERLRQWIGMDGFDMYVEHDIHS
jgi:hypothetical protein